MPYLDVNDCSVFYEDDDFTDPWSSAEVVWLQHGWGRSSQFFYHWVPDLARQYRVIRRDFRGHGKSCDPAADHSWSIEELLTDMLGFLDALEIDAIHYVGDSSGGLFGAAFAARWPDRIRSLTMMSTPIAHRNRNKTALVGRPDLATAILEIPMEEYARHTIETRGVSVLSPKHEAWVIAEWKKNRPRSLSGFASVFREADISQILENIAVPTLLLSPTKSATAPLDEQKAMALRIPGAKFVEIDGIGHEIYVDQAESCLTALKRFIADL